MTVKHFVGYSKSIRAKCHGSICKGAPLAVGTLRYGHTLVGEYGENIEWRHWGCVTVEILSRLATLTIDRVIGFQNLRSTDQQKVRMAISLCRVDPADIPESAQIRDPVQASASSGASSQRKRKTARECLALSSQPSGSQVVVLTQTPASEQVEEEVEGNTPEGESKDELYCSLTTNVVGIQYYHGLVGPGEEVLLAREPQNPYDRNAIQVKNISQTQVGHLPRKVAGQLAPLLDRRLITVEGVINDGNLSGRKGYTLSITLRIYGGLDMRDRLEPMLVWATPGQRGFPSPNPAAMKQPNATGSASNSRAGPSASMGITAGAGALTQGRARARQSPTQVENAHKQQEAIRKQQEALQRAAELRQMLNTLEKVDDEGRRSSLLDALCSTDDVLNLPLHPDPPGTKTGDLTVDLLKHQCQALQWCVEREYPVLPKKESDKPVQFWLYRKTGNRPYYYNIATKTPQETAPLLGRGALCADAMGLGKTLTMLALVLATKSDVPPDFSNSTLIVAPLSVLSNWEKQIEDHCTPGSLTCCVYYGSKRFMSPEELSKYDVVITTYQTIVGEHVGPRADGPSKKKKRVEKTLAEIKWKRIILDEGHTIRNPKTQMANAVSALKAQRRWVVTGTPIINSPRDLGSLLTFLQICQPLDNEDFYRRLLLRPLKSGEASGVELLRALMSHICIRRTKEMQDSKGNSLIPLSPVEMVVVPVALNDEARVLYDDLERLSQQRFQQYMSRGEKIAGQSNVLSMLTRMRQAALHPGLVPASYLEQLRAADVNEDAPARAVLVSPEDKIRLQGLLAQAIEDCEECPICFGILAEPRITSCAHAFCLPCITEVVSRDPKCPMDRRPLTMGDLHEPPPMDLTQVRRDEEPNQTGTHAGSSSKIDQLVHLLRFTPSTEKSLVFSQFTSFLDKIAEIFEEEGIPFVRFDGQMSAKRRQETIARFSVPLTDDTDDISTTQTHLLSRRRQAHRSLPGGRSTDDGHDDLKDNGDDDDLSDADKPTSRTKAKGKGKTLQRGVPRANRHIGSLPSENPKVMLISLKAGALGLNLTVANNVYLMDPWWQEGIESQAVDRVNRIGQKKAVHVYQLIAENTVESKVLEIQERKKQLIQQAFSGIKRTETQRQQREARIQDLIELFGMRASQAAARN